jgi:hypothetical protein
VLLHKENAQYGFRRNLLGLKPIAILLLVAALAISGSAWWLGFPASTRGGAVVFTDAAARWPLYAATLGSLACLSTWLLLIRRHFVLLAADECAIALFRTLEE